jgi:basic membrane protein A
MRDRLGVLLIAWLVSVTAACAGPPPIESPTVRPSVGPTAAASASRPATAASAVPSPDASASVPPPTCAEPLLVGLVTDVGTVKDAAKNQATHDGLLAAAEAAPGCFTIDVIETASPADFAANIATFTGDDRDVIVGVGLLIGDALGDAAREHGDRTFIAVDGVPSTGHDDTWGSNGVSLLFAEDQAGYLAGVLAASMSAARHVGVVAGPVVIPPMERFVEGFVDGARSVQPSIVTDVAYAASFDDRAEGKGLAASMTEAGADVIFGVGGSTGHGAIEAACEADVLAIGVETDLYERLPDARPCLLSSAMKDISRAVEATLLRVARGEMVPGVDLQDASTGGVRLAPFHDLASDVSPTTRTRLAAALAGLADGSIVPDVTIDGQ